MSDSDTMGGLAAQDSYDPFAAEQFVPPAAADWAKQAAPQDVATLRAVAQPIMGALAAPGQALASTTPISSEQMIAPAAGIAGLTTLGAGAAPATANELRMGIKAYHGSPYDFDKFDLSKIGTGEGAQAYGHGLYFAENEGVAKSYRDALSPVAGETLGWKTQGSAPLTKQIINAFGGDMDAAIANAEKYAVQKRSTPGSAYPTALEELKAIKAKGRNEESPGKMYQVDINADPAHFLDWDKRLSEMSPEVQQRLKDAWLAHPEGHSRQSGAQIYEASRLVPGEYRDPIAASRKLSEAGIPGIKYLDQGSRGPSQQIEMYREQLKKPGWSPEMRAELQSKLDELLKQPPPSSNYVVFNPEIINILRKYGLAGAAPAGMGALAAQDNYQQ